MRFESPYGIPHPARHARKRYIERARDNRFDPGHDPDDRAVGYAVLDAWREALVVDPPHGRTADVLKYHHGRRILLCRLDTDITTVISMSTVDEPATVRAIDRTKRAYAEQS